MTTQPTPPASETPRTDSIAALIRRACNVQTHEEMCACREGAINGIEALERELTALQTEFAALKRINNENVGIYEQHAREVEDDNATLITELTAANQRIAELNKTAEENHRMWEHWQTEAVKAQGEVFRLRACENAMNLAIEQRKEADAELAAISAELTNMRHTWSAWHETKRRLLDDLEALRKELDAAREDSARLTKLEALGEVHISWDYEGEGLRLQQVTGNINDRVYAVIADNQDSLRAALDAARKETK